MTDHQDLENAASCLEALGSPTRLEIYRLLVRAGPGGAAVGELQERMGIPASTLSHHISKLVRVGLVTQQRQSRTLLCHANYERMNGLLAYLGEMYSGGWVEILEEAADSDISKLLRLIDYDIGFACDNPCMARPMAMSCARR